MVFYLLEEESENRSKLTLYMHEAPKEGLIDLFRAEYSVMF